MKQAFLKIHNDIQNKTKITTSDGKVERTYSMDEEEYEHIIELAEKDEFIDFEIPKDAPLGKRMSESILGTDEKLNGNDPQIPVNLEEIFGGDISG